MITGVVTQSAVFSPKSSVVKDVPLYIKDVIKKQTLKTLLDLNEGYFPLKIVSWQFQSTSRLFHGRPVTSLCTCASVASWVSSSVSKCWPFNSILACGLSYTEANLASGAGGEQRSSRSEPKKTACWVGTRWLSGKQFWLFPLNVLPQLPQDITVKLSVCSLSLGDTFTVHDIMTVGKTNTKGACRQSDSSHFMLPSGFLCIHFNSVLFM